MNGQPRTLRRLPPVNERTPVMPPVPPTPKHIPRSRPLDFVDHISDAIQGERLDGETDPLTLDNVDKYYYKCKNSKGAHYFSANNYFYWRERSIKARRCPLDFAPMDFHLYRQPDEV